MTKKEPLSQLAESYSKRCHEETNHLYDGKPYCTHLKMVVDAVKRHIGTVPLQFHEDIIAAAWCHDVIEDTRQNYSTVRFVIGLVAADIVYALTNEKGRNRQERASKAYYEGITATPFATLVKICDRIANTAYSLEVQNGMFEMYAKEYPKFKRSLTHSVTDTDYNNSAWEELEKLHANRL